MDRIYLIVSVAGGVGLLLAALIFAVLRFYRKNRDADPTDVLQGMFDSDDDPLDLF